MVLASTASFRRGTMKIYNFAAGPAMLPEVVMRKAQAEFLDYQGPFYHSSILLFLFHIFPFV